MRADDWPRSLTALLGPKESKATGAFSSLSIVEQPTDSTGWATLTFNRLTNFPVNGKQSILAMFLRARKAGENVLGGITGYRLVASVSRR